MADTEDLKSSVRKDMRVRSPLPAGSHPSLLLAPTPSSLPQRQPEVTIGRPTGGDEASRLYDTDTPEQNGMVDWFFPSIKGNAYISTTIRTLKRRRKRLIGGSRAISARGARQSFSNPGLEGPAAIGPTVNFRGHYTAQLGAMGIGPTSWKAFRTSVRTQLANLVDRWLRLPRATPAECAGASRAPGHRTGPVIRTLAPVRRARNGLRMAGRSP